jgi:homocysteine S-methyltransferase
MDRTWRWLTDGGLETDLIFHRGIDLPEFAAYPLLWTDDGRAVLRDYYEGYAALASTAGAGLRLEAPTWRANPDWAALLGHGPAELHEAHHRAVDLLREVESAWRDRLDGTRVVGMVGPRSGRYAGGEGWDADEAADYHAPALAAMAAAGADEAVALTLTDTVEAVGVVRAAEAAGLPVVVSFTVETDGRLLDGTSLAAAVDALDATAPPAYVMVNCAHPRHVLAAVADRGAWLERVSGLRSNASLLSHAEIDEAETLDEGDLDVLVPAHRQVEACLPALDVVGGCCGTDVRHVAALWDLPGQRSGTNR